MISEYLCSELLFMKLNERRMQVGSRGTSCTQEQVMAYSSKLTAWIHALYYNSYLQRGVVWCRCGLYIRRVV